MPLPRWNKLYFRVKELLKQITAGKFRDTLRSSVEIGLNTRMFNNKYEFNRPAKRSLFGTAERRICLKSAKETRVTWHINWLRQKLSTLAEPNVKIGSQKSFFNLNQTWHKYTSSHVWNIPAGFVDSTFIFRTKFKFENLNKSFTTKEKGSPCNTSKKRYFYGNLGSYLSSKR